VSDGGLAALYESIIPELAFHTNLGDYGGQEGEGKELSELWSYVESELSAWRLVVWPGDERAFPSSRIAASGVGAPRQQYIDSVDASQKTGSVVIDTDDLDAVWAPKTVHIHKPTLCAGRGFTFHYLFFSAWNAQFYGVGGKFVPGQVSRKIISLQSPPG
jgi:hypothetical protein